MSEPYESRKAAATVYPFVKGCEVYSCHLNLVLWKLNFLHTAICS